MRRKPRLLRQVDGLRLLPRQGRGYAESLRPEQRAPRRRVEEDRPRRLGVRAGHDHRGGDRRDRVREVAAYGEGVDGERVAWLGALGSADETSTHTSVRQRADRASAVNLNMGTLVGSYAPVGDHAGRGGEHRRRPPRVRRLRSRRRGAPPPHPTLDVQPPSAFLDRGWPPWSPYDAVPVPPHLDVCRRLRSAAVHQTARQAAPCGSFAEAIADSMQMFIGSACSRWRTSSTVSTSACADVL